MNLQEEQWCHSCAESDPISSSKATLLPRTELSSKEKQALQDYHKMFSSKEFLGVIHLSQGLPTFVTQNAYYTEKKNFKKNVKEVHVSKITSDAIIIPSHVLYKKKVKDDYTLMIKARIAPHGNKD